LRQPGKLEAAMKTIPSFLLAAVIALILSAPAAQAFTFEKNASGDNLVDGLASGARPYTDPDEKLESSKARSSFDDAGGSFNKQDGLSLQFGPRRSFDQEFNPNNLYDPLRR
jgi:hypothetical protein